MNTITQTAASRHSPPGSQPPPARGAAGRRPQIAPVFDRDVLPQRQYRGGPIRFEVTLGRSAGDTALAAIFKKAADASLGVIAGMVETATLAGPAAILGKAGESIVGGVRSAITDTGKDRPW